MKKPFDLGTLIPEIKLSVQYGASLNPDMSPQELHDNVCPFVQGMMKTLVFEDGRLTPFVGALLMKATIEGFFKPDTALYIEGDLNMLDDFIVSMIQDVISVFNDHPDFLED